MKKTVSFDIGDLMPIGITLVVLGIALSFGLGVMEDTQEDMITNTAGCNSTDTTGCGVAYNATTDAITGVAKLPAKLPLIVTVVVAALIIGLLIRYFLRQ